MVVTKAPANHVVARRHLWHFDRVDDLKVVRSPCSRTSALGAVTVATTGFRIFLAWWRKRTAPRDRILCTHAEKEANMSCSIAYAGANQVDALLESTHLPSSNLVDVCL